VTEEARTAAQGREDEWNLTYDPIRDLRYVVAELRTRGEAGLADIAESATTAMVARLVAGVEPVAHGGDGASEPSPAPPRRWFYRDLFRFKLLGKEWLLELRSRRV